MNKPLAYKRAKRNADGFFASEVALLDFFREHQSIQISLVELSDQLGWCTTEIFNRTKQLQERGYIKIKPGLGGPLRRQCNTYYLVKELG